MACAAMNLKAKGERTTREDVFSPFSAFAQRVLVSVLVSTTALKPVTPNLFQDLLKRTLQRSARNEVLRYLQHLVQDAWHRKVSLLNPRPYFSGAAVGSSLFVSPAPVPGSEQYGCQIGFAETSLRFLASKRMSSREPQY